MSELFSVLSSWDVSSGEKMVGQSKSLSVFIFTSLYDIVTYVYCICRACVYHKITRVYKTSVPTFDVHRAVHRNIFL